MTETKDEFLRLVLLGSFADGGDYAVWKRPSMHYSGLLLDLVDRGWLEWRPGGNDHWGPAAITPAGLAVLEERAGRTTPPSFTCPRCGRTSHHPKDIEHRYCGACHTFPENRDGV